MPSLFSDFHSMLGRTRRFLKFLGMISPAQTKAKAFARLQAKLFRFESVVVIAVQGFAVYDPKSSTTTCEIQIVTSMPATRVMKEEIERIFLQVNASYDVVMIPVFA